MKRLTEAPACIRCGANIENPVLLRTGSLTCEDCRPAGNVKHTHG